MTSMKIKVSIKYFLAAALILFLSAAYTCCFALPLTGNNGQFILSPSQPMSIKSGASQSNVISHGTITQIQAPIPGPGYTWVRDIQSGSGDLTMQVDGSSFYPFRLGSNGNFTITGTYTGNGSGLTNLIGPINVKDFGALGDGSTDDTLAIRAAILAAGTNGAINFNPTKIYLISGGLTQLDGQKWYGRGATIKRRNQITNNITGPFTGGTVTLASATSFRVGMGVAFANGAVARTNLDTSTSLSANVTITNISGNVITIDPVSVPALTNGAICFLSFYSIIMAENGLVTDFFFDGNRDNFTFSRWETESEIQIKPASGTANHCIVQNCIFTNSPSEGIFINGTGNKVVNCNLKNIGGNGIHFSGASSTLISLCTLEDGNLDLTNGHPDGALTWSDNITDTTVVGVTITNCLAGFGGISGGDSNITATACTIVKCRKGIDINGAGGAAPKNIKLTDINIIGCNASFQNCGDIIWKGGSIYGGTNLVLTRCTNSIFSFLTFKNGTGISNPSHLINSSIASCIFDFTGDITSKAFAFSNTNLSNSILKDNTFIEGDIGVYIDAGTLNGFKIERNHFIGQYDGGIQITSSLGAQGGLFIVGNDTITTSASASFHRGIRVDGTNVIVLNNLISNPGGASAANYGISVNNNYNTIKDNTVLGTYNVASIRFLAGATNTWNGGNLTDTAVSDLGSGTITSTNYLRGGP